MYVVCIFSGVVRGCHLIRFFFNWFVFNFSLFLLRSVKVMTAESPLTSVDFMSDGGTLAVGSTRGLLST